MALPPPRLRTSSNSKLAAGVVTAPALVFDDQLEVVAAFKAGKLARDFVAVIRYQGPRANGMPELHQLTPALRSLQDKGFHVALSRPCVVQCLKRLSASVP